MSRNVICCPDLQISAPGDSFNCDLEHFRLWAQNTPKTIRSHDENIDCLPKGVSNANYYLRVITFPPRGTQSSLYIRTQTFIPKPDSDTPYQEVAQESELEPGYKMVVSSPHYTCSKHRACRTINMYKRRKRPHLASKGGAQIQTSVTQEDKPSSPSAVEKADNDLCSLEPSTLPPVEIGLGPSSTFVEDKRHEQQEDSLPSEPRYFYPFPPVKPFSYDTTPFKAKMKHTYRVQSEKSTSSNLETPNYEQKVIPSVNVIRKRNYQYAYPPTFSSGNSKAITSSTVAEKIQDADWTEKPTASQPSDKKPSRSSTIPEKEGISPARLEVATIPAGVIEDAIKRLKIADVQAAHSSSSTDPTVTRAVADLATSVDNPDVDAGSDPAPNDTPSPDDIFYVPSEQPERTPEAETENVCKLEEEDFEYYYPRLISHTYAEYDDKEWVDVMASKDWEDHESYA